MSKYDFSKPIKEGKTYNILKPLGVLISRIFFKIKYIGKENIPADGGYIIASNHIHGLDPLIIALGLPKKKQMHFMAKKELWDNPFTAWCFTKVNGFPVSRGRADTTSFKHAIEVIKKGFILGIFPEGTRSKDGTPQKARRGVSAIAASAKSGILPVAVYNNEGCKFRSKYTVKYGKFIPYEDLGFSEEPTREEQIAAADFIMDKIKELWEEGHCE